MEESSEIEDAAVETRSSCLPPHFHSSSAYISHPPLLFLKMALSLSLSRFVAFREKGEPTRKGSRGRDASSFCLSTSFRFFPIWASVGILYRFVVPALLLSRLFGDEKRGRRAGRTEAGEVEPSRDASGFLHFLNVAPPSLLSLPPV